VTITQVSSGASEKGGPTTPMTWTTCSAWFVAVAPFGFHRLGSLWSHRLEAVGLGEKVPLVMAVAHIQCEGGACYGPHETRTKYPIKTKERQRHGV